MKEDLTSGIIVPSKNIATSTSNKLHQLGSYKHTTNSVASNSILSDIDSNITEVSGISNRDKSNSTSNNRLDSLNLQRVTINSDDLINGKYLPSALLNNLIKQSGKSVVLVAAGLGVGKSTAASQMMHDYYGGLGVAVSHRVKLTSQLCANFGATNYDHVKQLEGGEKLERLGTTAQSLAMMINHPLCSAAFSGGLLVIDESNSVASEFTGKTIKNEAATMAALKQAISKSRTTLCLDAHIDSSTLEMLKAAGVDAADMLLIEVKKPELEGYKLNIFENELDSKGKSLTKPAVINQVIADMRKGKKVIVASLSASFLNTLERQVDKAGLFGAIKITGETKRSVFDSLNSETYGDYQLVMLSPAMSTGISFDKYHADECYVFLSNNDGTGSYQDGLQAMLRDRAIKSKTINCIYEEGTKPLTTADEVMIYQNRQLQALERFIDENGLSKQFNQVRPRTDSVNKFLWSEMTKQAEEKQEFLNLFIRECNLKRATIQKCGASEFAEGDVTGEVLAADKKEVEQLRVDSIVNAEKLEDEHDLSDEIDLKPMQERLRIEKFAAVDFDDLPELERVELVNKVAPADENKSCINRIRRIERSFVPAAQLKKQVEIAVIGARNDETDRPNFVEKITTRKIHWIDQAHYTRLALKACGVTGGDDGLIFSPAPALDENSVKGNTPAKALYLALKRNPERAIVCGMLGAKVTKSDVEDIKTNTFQYMINLITGLGIKLKKSRGKEQYKPDADFLQFDINMINRRKLSGIDESKSWLDRIDEYLQAHLLRKSKAEALNHAVTDKVPSSIAAAIGLALDKIGQPDLLHDAIEALEPFHSRIQKQKLSMIEIEFIVRRYTDNL